MAQTPGQQSKASLFVRMWKWVVGTWPGRIFGIVLLIALAILLYWWPDSGFDTYPVNSNVQRAKTLWDWLGLLGVPVVLAVGGYLFSRAERKNEREIAAQRVEQDRARTDDTLRQALVQDYLDRMSELLFDQSLATSKPDDLVREVARARTLTVLRGLGEDRVRKGYIVEFLYETGLIKIEEPIVELRSADLQKAYLSHVVLIEANLSEANLIEADLNEADLSKANLIGTKLTGAYLNDAYLTGANLSRANLSRADLNRADLSGANLSGANLIGTKLTGAYLNDAYLTGAYLFKAKLFEADLNEADLNEADLNEADLKDAKVTNQQLATAMSLRDAIMPDGSKYAGVPPTAGTPSPNNSTQGTQPNAQP